MAPSCPSVPGAMRARTSTVFALADLQDCLPEDCIAPAAPALASILSGTGDGEGARALAAFVLGRLGEHALPFAPLLAQVLTDPSMQVRMSAIGALGNIGPAAFPIASQLAELARNMSECEDVRTAAAEAFERITGERV